MKYYEFTVLPEKKVIKEKIMGRWTVEIAEQYYNDFKKAVAPLLGNPWSKFVDLNEWKTSSPEVVEVIGKHLDWAKKNQMKFSANLLKELVPRMQLKRMFKEGGTANFSDVFETEKEAIDWLASKGF